MPGSPTSRTSQVLQHLSAAPYTPTNSNSQRNNMAQPKIVVHWLNESRAHRTLWLMEELGLQYEIKEYKRNKEMRAPPELKEVHPLGKSPVVEVETEAGSGKMITLAESGAIQEFLIERFDTSHKLSPSPQDGPEARAKYLYWLHYAEGTPMTPAMIALVAGRIPKQGPWLVKPITNAVANGILTQYVGPEIQKNLEYLSSTISSSGSGWISPSGFSSADILLSFPLECLKFLSMVAYPDGEKNWQTKYSNLEEWLKKCKSTDGWKKVVEKVGDLHLDSFSK